MGTFFKTVGIGLLVIVLSPLIVLFFALYFLYCLVLFMYEGIRSLIVFFKGGTPFGELPEDVKAKEIMNARLMEPLKEETPPAPQVSNTDSRQYVQQNIYIQDASQIRNLSDLANPNNQMSMEDPRMLQNTQEVPQIEATPDIKPLEEVPDFNVDDYDDENNGGEE